MASAEAGDDVHVSLKRDATPGGILQGKKLSLNQRRFLNQISVSSPPLDQQIMLTTPGEGT